MGLPTNLPLGIREFRYRINEPIFVRYIFWDGDLLKDLNDRYSSDISDNGFMLADTKTLREYQSVIRFRETQVFDPGIKAALRKIHEGITELVMYRMLAGQDKFILREDILENLEGDI